MLKAKNISKNFGEIKVLDNINFHVDKGSIVSIYGSSGAGKSTLLYILSSLDKPDNCEIHIDNYQFLISKVISFLILEMIKLDLFFNFIICLMSLMY